MFAAYINNRKACEILIKFLLDDEEFLDEREKLKARRNNEGDIQSKLKIIKR